MRGELNYKVELFAVQSGMNIPKLIINVHHELNYSDNRTHSVQMKNLDHASDDTNTLASQI